MIRAAIAALALFLSCSHPHSQKLTGYPMVINNVYAHPSYDHSEMLNVLILPVDNPLDSPSVSLHYENLLLSALRNFGKFNYFNVYHDPHFDHQSGPAINLDTGYLDRVKIGELGRQYNAEGLLKISVTDWRAFPPMRMKVKALLVDADTGERVWAFDHTFDMDDAAVVNALRSWYNYRMAGGDEKNRFEVSHLRPSVFSNFVFYTMARSYERERVKNIQAVEDVQLQTVENSSHYYESYENPNRPFADMNKWDNRWDHEEDTFDE